MPDEAPVTSATGFLSFIGLPSRRWSVIIVHSPYDEHHIVRQKKNTGYDRCGSPWGTSARPGAWRWGSGLRAPTREGTPKHATGTCACPSQLRASELRLRGALACKAPSAPTPSATITCADVPLGKKPRQVDGVRHHAVARFVGMQVVARVGERQEAGGPRGIAQHRVEVDDRLERAARPDPPVDRLPRRLALRPVVVRSSEP